MNANEELTDLRGINGMNAVGWLMEGGRKLYNSAGGTTPSRIGDFKSHVNLSGLKDGF